MEQPFGRILSIIAKSYLQSLNRMLSELDIERSYFALILIENAEGKITQQELADLLEIDKVTMLRSIDYLSAKGYVKRLRNNNDRRKYSLELTEKAVKALPKIKSAFLDMNNITLKGITEDQISELKSVLKIISNNLKENRLKI